MSEEERITFGKLKLLSVGCKTHKAYRGLRQPRAGCEVCSNIFEAMQQMVAAKWLPGERRVRVDEVGAHFYEQEAAASRRAVEAFDQHQ